MLKHTVTLIPGLMSKIQRPLDLQSCFKHMNTNRTMPAADGEESDGKTLQEQVNYAMLKNLIRDFV